MDSPGGSRCGARSRNDGVRLTGRPILLTPWPLPPWDGCRRLLAIKWQRMAASPFGFFRGAVPVIAADLAVLPHTGIFTQLCGDAHVRNLGAFAAPDGRLVFDINDFDETIRGPV